MQSLSIPNPVSDPTRSVPHRTRWPFDLLSRTRNFLCHTVPGTDRGCPGNQQRMRTDARAFLKASDAGFSLFAWRQLTSNCIESNRFVVERCSSLALRLIGSEMLKLRRYRKLPGLISTYEKITFDSISLTSGRFSQPIARSMFYDAPPS